MLADWFQVPWGWRERPCNDLPEPASRACVPQGGSRAGQLEILPFLSMFYPFLGLLRFVFFSGLTKKFFWNLLDFF